jgi:ABC-type phosphate transport system substrate-binding protein
VSPRLLARLVAAIVVLAAGNAALPPLRAAAPPPATEGLSIIVNPESGVTRITRAELARVFLGKKTLWESSQRIQPAMLNDDSAAIRGFIEGNLQRTVDQYRAYWKHLLFSGGGTAPRSFRSSAEVVDFVAKDPGGIGLVLAGKFDDRVKVVELSEGR